MPPKDKEEIILKILLPKSMTVRIYLLASMLAESDVTSTSDATPEGVLKSILEQRINKKLCEGGHTVSEKSFDELVQQFVEEFLK